MASPATTLTLDRLGRDRDVLVGTRPADDIVVVPDPPAVVAAARALVARPAVRLVTASRIGAVLMLAGFVLLGLAVARVASEDLLDAGAVSAMVAGAVLICTATEEEPPTGAAARARRTPA